MADTWVQRIASDFARAIESELPQGEAWPRDPDGDLVRWVEGCAEVYGDVAARSADLLLVESDPRATFELLPEWERAFGLPDACNHEAETIESRRVALVARITAQGGQSRAFLIAQAAALGYQISIYEYRPYMCGQGVCGETRIDADLELDYAHCGSAMAGRDHLCEISLSGPDDWTWRLGPPGLRAVWRVAVLNERLTWLRGGIGQAGVDHMCEFSLASDLECLFRRIAPGQSLVIFDYSGTRPVLATEQQQPIITKNKQFIDVVF